MAKFKTVLTADEHTALPDADKALYEAVADNPGQFVLAVDGIDDHPAVRGMKSALTRLKGDEAKLRKMVAGLPEGVTPEKIQQLLEAEAKAEEEKARAAGQWDKLKDQLVGQHQQQLAAERTRVQRRDDFLRKIVLESDAVRALTEAGVDARGVRLLLPHLMSNLEAVVSETGDAFSMELAVVGSDRKPRLSPTGNGAAMSVAELVMEMRKHEDFALAFPSSGTSGTGAPPSNRPGSGGVRKLSDLAPDQRAAYIKEHGVEAYNALIAADSAPPTK